MQGPSQAGFCTGNWSSLSFPSRLLSCCGFVQTRGYPSVCPSCTPCLLCNSYSSGWILSILVMNGHWHKKMCLSWWSSTLSYVFKVFQPRLCNKTAEIWHIFLCPLYSIYNSGLILSTFGTNDHYHEQVCRMQWPLNFDLYLQGHLSMTLQ